MLTNGWQPDPDSPLPFYYQLQQLLEREITNRGLKKGEFLPAEGDIAQSCQVSVGVVRQALERLEKSGLILRKKGKRAMVRSGPKVKLEFMDTKLSHFLELTSKGLAVSTRVLEQELIAPSPTVGAALQLEPGENVVKISRLRFVEDRPAITWISFLPESLCPGLEKLDLVDRSLYVTLKERYGLVPTNAERSFEIVYPDLRISELLQVRSGEPVIYLEWLSFLQDGRVVEFYEGFHVTANWKFIFHI